MGATLQSASTLVCPSLLCLSNLHEPEHYKTLPYTRALLAMNENAGRDDVCIKQMRTSFLCICCNNYFYCIYIASGILCNLEDDSKYMHDLNMYREYMQVLSFLNSTSTSSSQNRYCPLWQESHAPGM